MRTKPGINPYPVAQPLMHRQASPLKHEKIIFETDLVKIGIFRARPGDPHFHDSGPVQNNIIVFPLTSVQITHVGHDPNITNPNLVMFYNQGQIYRRDKISERGDICEWFGLSSTMLFDAFHPIQDNDLGENIPNLTKIWNLRDDLLKPLAHLRDNLVCEFIHVVRTEDFFTPQHQSIKHN